MRVGLFSLDTLRKQRSANPRLSEEGTRLPQPSLRAKRGISLRFDVGYANRPNLPARFQNGL